MAEYSKKTVAELQEVLKSRGLPSSGKKADLVARLTEADKIAEPAEVTEIAPAPESAPAEPESVAQPAEEPAIENAVNDEPAQPAAEPTTESAAVPAEQKSFALNLAASDIDKEMEKRKARAARFNTGAQADPEATETATVDSDALKHLERAKRFGMGTNAIGKLDEALSDTRGKGPRGRKRGAPDEDSHALVDTGLKQSFNRKGRFNGRKKGGPGNPTGVGKPSSSVYNSDKDRQAAEARKKRFSTA